MKKQIDWAKVKTKIFLQRSPERWTYGEASASSLCGLCRKILGAVKGPALVLEAGTEKVLMRIKSVERMAGLDISETDRLGIRFRKHREIDWSAVRTK